MAEPLPQPPTTLHYLRVPRFCWPFPVKAPRGWCDSGWVLLLVQRPGWILPGAGPHCKPGGDAQMGQMVAQLIRVKSPVISSFHGSPLALVRPAPGRDLWQTSCHRFIEGHMLALPHQHSLCLAPQVCPSQKGGGGRNWRCKYHPGEARVTLLPVWGHWGQNRDQL